MGALNEYGPIRRIALRHARDAFGSREAVERQWRELGYKAAPDFDQAVAEYDLFAETIADSGAEIVFLPASGALSLDAIYVRDQAMAPAELSFCGPQGKGCDRSALKSQ